VVNLTSGDDPGISAQPGDTLEYTVDIANTGSLGTTLSLLDEIDALNAPPAFVVSPGSLTVTAAPAGSTDNSNPDGGANGSGIVDISNIDISESGGGNDSVQIVFQADLQAPLPNGKVIANQATVSAPALSDRVSDNPNTPADADDPTVTIIGSAPEFRFEKVSEDITGDPGFLETGDTLRYTITVKNIGDADTVESTLVDQVPANATYVAGSTTLNGDAIADPAEGVSPLEDGILINSPDETTAGVLTADEDEAAVGTVGSLTVTPNATNVVPGRVTLGIDVRSIEYESMEHVVGAVREELSRLETDRGVTTTFERGFDLEPTPMAERCREALHRAGEDAGIDTHPVYSGAAHDSMHVASVTDAGLLFAPSRGGVSHNPREWTSKDDCADATRVLAGALADLAGGQSASASSSE
jgi:uncharacterized repeat protein (TIGR01451 family)